VKSTCKSSIDLAPMLHAFVFRFRELRPFGRRTLLAVRIYRKCGMRFSLCEREIILRSSRLCPPASLSPLLTAGPRSPGVYKCDFCDRDVFAIFW
jgi:hypothetical protein